MTEIYLDYNASTPVAPEVKQAMLPLFEHYFGNPSAAHETGSGAKAAVEKARAQAAGLFACKADEVVFTSGGSEANNHVIKGVFETYGYQGCHIITSSVEHPAVIESCRYLQSRGAKVTYLPVDQFGMVAPEDVAAAIEENTILITIMHANNETGTLQPVEDIGAIAKRHGALFHSDAAQSAGKVPVNMNELNVDFLSAAGHKLYAPKGVGALIIREGVQIEPLIHGAGHERGRRAGTESAPLAAGFGAACDAAKKNLPDQERIKALRDRLWDGIQTVNHPVSLNGHVEKRLPNTLNINFEGVQGADLLRKLHGVAASTGSACHTGSVELSPVLEAMNVSAFAGMGAIRFSLGRYTTENEINRLLAKLSEQFNR